MTDRELPVMTDEAVDDVYRAALAFSNGEVDRSTQAWCRLRAAFPAPRPPRPEGKWFRVGEDGGHILCSFAIGPEFALAALAELQACVDWITEEAQSDG